MADPTAVAELKVKRVTDYDDVVRDYRKRAGYLATLGFEFNRDCARRSRRRWPSPSLSRNFGQPDIRIIAFFDKTNRVGAMIGAHSTLMG